MNNNMMFFENKLEKFIQILNQHRYKNRFADFKIYICDGEIYDENKLKEINIAHRWGGYDKYCWLKMNVSLPIEFENSENKLGFFDFGLTGGGNNSGFESLCYINNKKYQGVDTNHQEVFLPKTLKDFEIKFFLWSGLDGGGNEKPINLIHEIKKSEFLILDKPVDELYFLIKAIHQSLLKRNENEKIYVKICEAVENIYNKFELTDSKKISEQAEKLFLELKNSLSKINEEKQTILRCIGHTHIDVAWEWRYKHTREKAQRSFSTVLRLMEKYPEYIFLQSQPQLYQYIKEDAPELYEEIKHKIKEGRWEANGAAWLEPDCILPSGESFVRHLLYGRKFFQEEFGITSNCLWAPDTFGFTAALPQILKKSGINTLSTNKMMASKYNHIPNDIFFWKGIDGSEILSYFVTTPSNGDIPRNTTCNGKINAGTLKVTWDKFKNKNLTSELLLNYGHGDGGGGVNREMLEMLDKFSMIPSDYKINRGTVKEFFDNLHKEIQTKKYNVWSGEMYLEYHRGTYTTQANTKKNNRQIEYLLRNAEIFACIYDKNNYSQEKFICEWKKTLTNQFHDVLPGTSITEVYEDVDNIYADIRKNLNKNIDDIISDNVKKEKNSWSVFNFNNFRKYEIVFIETNLNFDFKDDKGNILLKQKNMKGYFVEVELFPLCATSIFGTEISETFSYISTNVSELENEIYFLKWNDNGQLISIFDKVQDREMLTQNTVGNELCLFEDINREYDAWELEPYYENKKYSLEKFLYSKIIEDGSLVKTVEFSWEHNKSKITQKMILKKNSKRIDFDTHVDWHENQKILRSYFPINAETNFATFDIQFGNITRPSHKNTSWDFARFEVFAHKWVDVSQRGTGVALLNDCKYGYSVDGSKLGISLLKSAKSPDKNADMGEHNFTYSILSHKNDWYDGDVEKEAIFLNNPPIIFEGIIKQVDSFEISENNIVLDAIKLSEDELGYILRFHEYAGKEVKAIIKPNLIFKKWTTTNLMEESSDDIFEKEIILNFSPYEIKTIKLLF